MRIDWAIPCRYAEVNDGLATIVAGGIDTFWPPAFPAPIGVMMVYRMVGTDPDGEHQFTNEVLGPDMQAVTETQVVTFNANLSPHGAPGWEHQMIVPVVVQFVAKERGAYTISTSVDGHSHTTSIRVVPQQEMPPT